MTYNVFGGTLSLTQSINHAILTLQGECHVLLAVGLHVGGAVEMNVMYCIISYREHTGCFQLVCWW